MADVFPADTAATAARAAHQQELEALGIFTNNFFAADGSPLGGLATGTGFTIAWQHGPLGRGADRKAPNGAFVEYVLLAVMDRLHCYQTSQFACPENAAALELLQQAVEQLRARTAKREARGVEGTLEV